MSLESNLHQVADKLAKDQSTLIHAFRLESFYKKYRVLIFVVLIALVCGAIFWGVYLYQESRKKEESTKILLELHKISLNQENEQNEEHNRKSLEKELQRINPILYDFYTYTNLQQLSLPQLMQEDNLAKLQNLSQSKHQFIATLARYQYASLTQDLHTLESFQSAWEGNKDSQSNTLGDILKDRATLQAAYIYLQNNNIAKADKLLDSIAFNGNNQVAYQAAKGLRHYGVTELSELKDTDSDKAESPTKKSAITQDSKRSLNSSDTQSKLPSNTN